MSRDNDDHKTGLAADAMIIGGLAATTLAAPIAVAVGAAAFAGGAVYLIGSTVAKMFGGK